MAEETSLARSAATTSLAGGEASNTSTKLALYLGASFLAGLGAAYLYKNSRRGSSSDASTSPTQEPRDANRAAASSSILKPGNIPTTRQKRVDRDVWQRESKLLNVRIDEDESWKSKVVVVVGLGGIGNDDDSEWRSTRVKC